MKKVTRGERRAVLLATVGLLILSVGALVIASKHNLDLAVAIGAIGVAVGALGSFLFLKNEYQAALGFWDLSVVICATAGILIGIHHQWIWETILGGVGLLCIFIALISIEVGSDSSCSNNKKPPP